MSVSAVDRAIATYRRHCAEKGVACTGEFNRVSLPTRLSTERGMECLSDALVLSGEWLVLTEGHIALDHFAARGLAPSSLYVAGGTPDRRVLIHDRPISSGVDSAFLLGGVANYAHWLLDTIPLLAYYGRVPSGTPIVVHKGLLGFQKESLAALEVPERLLLPLDEPGAYRFPHLWFPALASAVYLPPLTLRAEVLMWLRDRLLRGGERARGGRRLYVSRRSQSEDRQRLRNDEEVAADLARHGFETVMPEELTFLQQVSLFSDAEIVVAPHGAGLANCVFAPRSCKVIEMVGTLTDSWLKPGMIFEAMFAALGQRHRRVVGDGLWRDVPQGSLVLYEPYSMPPERIRAALASL